MYSLRSKPLFALVALAFFGCSSSDADSQQDQINDQDASADVTADTPEDSSKSDAAPDTSHDSAIADSATADSTVQDSGQTDSALDSAALDSAASDSSAADSALADSSAQDSAVADSATDAPSDTSMGGDGSVPPGYEGYANLSNQALISALHTLVAGHTSVGYDGAKKVLFGTSGFDVHNGKIECIYSGQLFDSSQLDKGGGFNTEHSWPQSQFGGESSTAKGDMHHLFPTERNINSCRSSNDFGDVTTFTSCSAGGSGLGKVGGSNVFMVRPKYRGDVARAHFYFAVRYSLHIGATEEAALKAWHHQDVPDTEEQNRNNAIYGIQKNRNPFVDWPDAVDKIADF